MSIFLPLLPASRWFVPAGAGGLERKTMKAEHTPTPWKTKQITVKIPGRETDHLIFGAGNEHICEVFQYQSRDLPFGPAKTNAEFIVKACNNHAKLLELLRAAIRLREVEEQKGDVVNWPKWFAEAKQAISKAQKG